jgi:hypothetical protein
LPPNIVEFCLFYIIFTSQDEICRLIESKFFLKSGPCAPLSLSPFYLGMRP